MDAITIKIRGNCVVPDVKEIMIGSSADMEKLPTSTDVGKFENSDANAPCAVGSIAYTPDFKFICQLGIDNAWHEV
jgi:hypothetical protein